MTTIPVFISYADPDFLHGADPLVKLLREYGMQVYSYRHKERLSPDYNKEIMAEIDRCEFVVMLWSAHAKKSNYVEREVAYAKYRAKRLVLVLLDNITKPDPLIAREDGIRAFDDLAGWPLQVAEHIKREQWHPTPEPKPTLPTHAPQWLRGARGLFVGGMAVLAALQAAKMAGVTLQKTNGDE